MKPDLEAIRARDAEWANCSEAVLLEAELDRRALLAYVDGLRSRLAEDEKLYDELNNDYVLVRNNRDEIARELGETNEALAACQSQGAGLQARLAEAEHELTQAHGVAQALEQQLTKAQSDWSNTIAAHDETAARLAEAEALRKDARCYHHLVGLIRANPTALAGEVLEWFKGREP